MIIEGLSKRAEFCQIDSGTQANFVEEWIYDFNLFKNQCHEKREHAKPNKNELKDKISQLKVDLIQQKEEQIKEKSAEKEQVELNKKNTKHTIDDICCFTKRRFIRKNA